MEATREGDGLWRHLPPLSVVAGAAFLLTYLQTNTWDIFWHLKAGQTFLETGEFLRRNTFSATFPDHPWPNPEWLFQILVALLHRFGGWSAVTLMKSAAGLLLGLLLYVVSFREARRRLPAASLAVLTLSLVQFRLHERPQLLSLLFFTLTVALLQDYRIRSSRALWALPPLFLLWGNVHPEFIVALLVMGAVMTGELLNARGSGRAGGLDFRLSAAIVLCAAATLFNPEGAHALLFPFQHLFIGPVVKVLEYRPTALTLHPLFWVHLLFTAFVLWTARRRRDWVELITLGGLALLGAAYLRAAAYLPLAAAPVLARRLREAGERSRRLTPGRLSALYLLLAASAMLWALGLDTLMVYRWGTGVNERLYPVAAADFIDRNDLPGRLYNNYGDGSYLIYRLYPKLGVFQDGRLQAYPQEFIARPNEKLSRDDWPLLLREFEVNTALVTLLQRSYLFRREEWATLYWDDQWSVLLRRTPRHEALIERLEYRLFNPGADIASLEGRDRLLLLEREMSRNQEERLSKSALVAVNRAVVLRRLGEDDKALAALRRAVSIDPDFAPAWGNLGSLLLELGRTEAAREAFERARRADADLPGIEEILRTLP